MMAEEHVIAPEQARRQWDWTGVEEEGPPKKFHGQRENTNNNNQKKKGLWMIVTGIQIQKRSSEPKSDPSNHLLSWCFLHVFLVNSQTGSSHIGLTLMHLVIQSSWQAVIAPHHG